MSPNKRFILDMFINPEKYLSMPTDFEKSLVDKVFSKVVVYNSTHKKLVGTNPSLILCDGKE